MKIFSMRGEISLLHIVILFVVLMTAFCFLYPKYQWKQMKTRFTAAVTAGDALYQNALAYYYNKSVWPSAMSDLEVPKGAKRLSDWEILDDLYTCEMAYGRGDKIQNDIICSPTGKFAKTISYQIVLGDLRASKRLCRASKDDENANKLCQLLGGKYSHTLAGTRPPLLIYTFK